MKFEPRAPIRLIDEMRTGERACSEITRFLGGRRDALVSATVRIGEGFAAAQALGDPRTRRLELDRELVIAQVR